MNPNWKNFLLSENAIFENDTDIVFLSSGDKGNKRIYPVTHLGVLTIAGNDAAKFLQGQITCNINDITDIKSSLGAICNPKGRAITTFLLVKNADTFLMILPEELLALVKKMLQMYVLRSDVTLMDSSDELCLIGLSYAASQSCDAAEHHFATSRQENIVVDLKNRCLIIADDSRDGGGRAPKVGALGDAGAVAESDNAQKFWLDLVKQGFQPEGSAQWRYLDIISGIPWLTVETSEEFIPQMLNLDKLGGISFNKGCYTGQEIIARTHYLGKAKREMFLAECDTCTPPEPNSTIIDDSAGTEQSIGKVLYAQNRQNICKMLIVLQVSDTNVYNLRLKNYNQDKIILLTV